MPADPTTTRLAARIADLERRLTISERTSRLASSSIEVGGQTVSLAAAIAPPQALDLRPYLSDGWAALAGDWGLPLARRYSDGRVFLEGLLTGPDTPGATLLTLPAGWRPASQQIFAATTATSTSTAGAPGFARLNVFADGRVSLHDFLSGRGGHLSLSGLTYVI